MIEFLAQLEPQYLLVGFTVLGGLLADAARHGRAIRRLTDLKHRQRHAAAAVLRADPRARHRRGARRRQPAHLQPPDARAGGGARRHAPGRRRSISRSTCRRRAGRRSNFERAGRRVADRRAAAEVAPDRHHCRLRHRLPAGAAVGPLLRRRGRARGEAHRARPRRARAARLLGHAAGATTSTCRSPTRSTAAPPSCRWPRARNTWSRVSASGLVVRPAQRRRAQGGRRLEVASRRRTLLKLHRRS